MSVATHQLGPGRKLS